MVELSMSLPEAPAARSLGKFAGWLGRAWSERRANAAFAGMSEREFQDIGWGQTDRWATQFVEVEPPEDRRARAIAVKAWLAPMKNAA
jgi:hypothetical protein